VDVRRELDERITESDGGVRLLVHCVGGTMAKPVPLAAMTEDDVRAAHSLAACWRLGALVAATTAIVICIRCSKRTR